MTLRLRVVETVRPGTGPAGPANTWECEAWQEWLHARIDPAWRPGEWQMGYWLFTRQPRPPPLVGVLVPHHGVRRRRLPPKCLLRHVCPRPPRQRPHPAGVRRHVHPGAHQGPTRAGRCALHRHRGRQRCVRPSHSKGLCLTHYIEASSRRRRGEDIERWARIAAIPYTDIPPCAVPACPRAGLDAHGLCHYHVCILRRHRRRAGDDPIDPRVWATTQTPYLARHQFSLNPLPQPLRNEVLYGLQQAEEWMRSLQPEYVRRLVDTITVDTLLAATPARAICPGTQKGVLRLVDRLCSAVQAGFAEFTGVPHLAGDVIDLRALGQRSLKGHPLKTAKTADLGVVQQQWLRTLLRDWTLTQTPNADSFARALHACILAARVLARRPDGGHDPSALGYGDVTAIVEAFRTALKKDGKPLGSSYRGTLVCKHLFWDQSKKLIWLQWPLSGGVRLGGSRPCSKVIWPHHDRVVLLVVGWVGDGSFEAAAVAVSTPPTGVWRRPDRSAGRRRIVADTLRGCRPRSRPLRGQRRRLFWVCARR